MGLMGSFIFQSQTGALEGPEVDGFVKDMMELVQVTSWARRPSGAGAAVLVDSTVYSRGSGLRINAGRKV